MRFLLVNPSYPISETPSPPLGLAYLGSALERAGVEVRVLDFVVYPYSKRALQTVLKDFSPGIVGVTAVTMTFDHAIQVIRDVKSTYPEIVTVMGGPHVTFCARESMEAFPELDLVLLGEGEKTIVDLVEALDGGGDFENIKNICYRAGHDIICSGFRRSHVDVDSLPVPARHLLPLGRYRALGMPVTMTTSRGCPFRCIFCVGRKMVGSKVRYRNPARVADELESLSLLDFPQINIADDLFTANKNHCLAICEEILKRRLSIKWAAFARVDTVSRELLKKMSEAGCHTISFGIESANADILRIIKKGITLEQATLAVRMCVEAGITAHASFILGLPGETPQTLKETVDFGEKLKDMGASYGFHLLAPFPGTEVRQHCDKFGLKIITSDWRRYHANRAVAETSSVSAGRLDEIAIEWETKFNEWLGYIKKRMEAGEATEPEAWQYVKLEHTALIYELMMGRIVEKTGSSAEDMPGASDQGAFRQLVKDVARATRFRKEQVNRTLAFALARGYLRRMDGGQGRWKWVDFL